MGIFEYLKIDMSSPNSAKRQQICILSWQKKKILKIQHPSIIYDLFISSFSVKNLNF